MSGQQCQGHAYIQSSSHTVGHLLTQGRIVKSPIVEAFVHLVEPRPQRCQISVVASNQYLFPTTEAELRYSHLYLVVLVLLLLQGCSLLLFLGLSKGVIILSNITIRPRGKHLKSRTTKMDPDSMQSRFSVCDSQLCQAPMAPCTSRRLLKHPAVELLFYILLVCWVRKQFCDLIL